MHEQQQNHVAIVDDLEKKLIRLQNLGEIFKEGDRCFPYVSYMQPFISKDSRTIDGTKK